MLKKILTSVIVSTSLLMGVADAGPGKPPPMRWTIFMAVSQGGSSSSSTYGTFATQAACNQSLNSIIQRNPTITDMAQDPLASSYAYYGISAMCIPASSGATN